MSTAYPHDWREVDGWAGGYRCPCGAYDSTLPRQITDCPGAMRAEAHPMTPRIALVVLDPLPLSEIAELNVIAERAFGVRARDLVVDANLSKRLGVVAIVRKATAEEGR
jgi:hypothetical protein